MDGCHVENKGIRFFLTVFIPVAGKFFWEAESLIDSQQ